MYGMHGAFSSSLIWTKARVSSDCSVLETNPRICLTAEWSWASLPSVSSLRASDRAGGSVEADEFLMGCLRLRGQARAVDASRLALVGHTPGKRSEHQGGQNHP